LTAGSSVYFPVKIEDKLFSLEDCHSEQGDGEACITAIEAPMSVTARFDVRSEGDLQQPQFRTSGPFTPTGTDESMYATSGIDSDLMDATKKAVRQMIDHLHDERGLSRADAYLLCSVAVDLKISQIVDAPNWTIDNSSDVDVALRFPDEMDANERFRLRNRTDAHLQEYAEGFVDVSDIGSLPTPVAHGALRDGNVLVGDEQAVESYREQVQQEYEATAYERERERREFIDRLARGDT